MEKPPCPPCRRGGVVAELGHDEVAAVGGRREGVHLRVARQVVARDVGREEVEDGLRRRALAGLSRPGGNDRSSMAAHSTEAISALMLPFCTNSRTFSAPGMVLSYRFFSTRPKPTFAS